VKATFCPPLGSGGRQRLQQHPAAIALRCVLLFFITGAGRSPMHKGDAGSGLPSHRPCRIFLDLFDVFWLSDFSGGGVSSGHWVAALIYPNFTIFREEGATVPFLVSAILENPVSHFAETTFLFAYAQHHGDLRAHHNFDVSRHIHHQASSVNIIEGQSGAPTPYILIHLRPVGLPDHGPQASSPRLTIL
jgi:hypothetical protein